jgi:hypothetical protein
MNRADEVELAALRDHRRGCRIAWIGALSYLATAGQPYPSVDQYERLENLLRSLKLSQRRIDVLTHRSALDSLRSTS